MNSNRQNLYIDGDLSFMKGNRSRGDMLSFDGEIGFLGGTFRKKNCGVYFELINVSLNLEKDFSSAEESKKNKTKNLISVIPEIGLSCKVGNILFSLGGGQGGFFYTDDKGADAGGVAGAIKFKLLSSKKFSLIGEVAEFNPGGESNIQKNIKIYSLKGTVPISRSKEWFLNFKAEDNSRLGTFGSMGIVKSL